MKFQIKFNFPLTEDELALNPKHVYVMYYYTQQTLKSNLTPHRIGDELYFDYVEALKVFHDCNKENKHLFKLDVINGMVNCSQEIVYTRTCKCDRCALF